jgi:hypothetical protein
VRDEQPRPVHEAVAQFADLGPDWHDRLAPLRRNCQLIAELERLSGKKVMLQTSRLTNPPTGPGSAALRRALPRAQLIFIFGSVRI